MTIWIFTSSLIDYTRFFAVARMLKVVDIVVAINELSAHKQLMNCPCVTDE